MPEFLVADLIDELQVLVGVKLEFIVCRYETQPHTSIVIILLKRIIT